MPSWAVSQSAPAFTPQQEQEERDNLNPEEAQEIENELHGVPVFDYDAFETPEQLEKSEQEVKDLIDVMPDIQKAAYLEALEKVPDIVEKETNTKMFLRCEHYNSQTAAERLAQHWKQRKLLFGPERAFLPMTLEGAMKDDMFQLEQGFVVRNPNDAHGRPVVFLDRSNSTKSEHYDRDGWLRCMWYIVQTFANEEEYQKTGYVCIINLKDYDANKSGDRIGAKKMFLYVRECWVPRFKAYHATYLSRQTPVKLVEPAIRQMQGPHIRLHLRNHYGYDSDNIEAMAKYGLKAEHLSKSIGGKQTLEDHLRWIEEQKAFEQKEPGE